MLPLALLFICACSTFSFFDSGHGGCLVADHPSSHLLAAPLPSHSLGAHTVLPQWYQDLLLDLQRLSFASFEEEEEDI